MCQVQSTVAPLVTSSHSTSVPSWKSSQVPVPTSVAETEKEKLFDYRMPDGKDVYLAAILSSLRGDARLL
jgi:hypothetical protein